MLSASVIKKNTGHIRTVTIVRVLESTDHDLDKKSVLRG